MIYDVIIVGAGPAGIMAALDIASRSNLTVAILERARRLNDARNVGATWFGGSARSAVKLYLDDDFGGKGSTPELREKFFKYFSEYYNGKLRPKAITKIGKKHLKKLAANGMNIKIPKTLQLAEESFTKASEQMYNHLRKNINIIHKVDITSIVKTEGIFNITSEDTTYHARQVLLATGRAGQEWLRKIDNNLNLSYTASSYQLGVRVEVPLSMFENFAGKDTEFELSWDDFNVSVPIRKSMIETEESGSLRIANARQYAGGKKSWVSFGMYKKFEHENSEKELPRLIELANVLGDYQLIKEPAFKFLNSGLLTPVKEYQQLSMGLNKLDVVYPGILQKAMIYAPDGKLNVEQFQIDANNQTTESGLYLIGDISGHTRSFIAAACSGLKSADHIISTSQKEK